MFRKNRNRNIWDEMRKMQKEMDTLFGNFFNMGPFGLEGSNPERRMLKGPASGDIADKDYRQPLADMWENDKEYVAAVELPGVDKKDIKVNATDDGVEVKVEKKDEKKDEDKKKGTYSYMKSYSGFYRYFSLPENADPSNIDASYKNGVLEMKFPKKTIDASKVKQIEVK